MGAPRTPEVYLLDVWIRGISPPIWRRLLIRSDRTGTDLHYTLEITFHCRGVANYDKLLRIAVSAKIAC